MPKKTAAASSSQYFFGWVAFLLAVAVLPGVPQQATVLRFAILSLAVPMMLYHITMLWCKHSAFRRWAPYQAVLVALLGYAALSILWATSLTEALNGLWRLFLFAGCIHIGFCLSGDTHTHIYKMFAKGMLVSLLLIVPLQMMNYIPPDSPWIGANVTPEPSGLFVNARMYGEASALSALSVVWTAPGLFLANIVAVFLSGSRTAMLAVTLAVAVVVYIAGKKSWRAALVVLAIGAGLTAISGHSLTPQAGMSTEVALEHVSSLRWGVWKDTISGLTPLGHGIGQFYVDFPSVSTSLERFREMRPEYAHNEPLHYLFELGLPGSLLLVALFAYALNHRAAWSDPISSSAPQLLIVLALITEMFFGFPLHMPCTLFLGGLALGHLLSLRRSHVCGLEPVEQRGSFSHHDEFGRYPSGVVVLPASGRRRADVPLGSFLVGPPSGVPPHVPT